MHKPVIKLWFIACFAVCGVFSHGTVTLKTPHTTQIKFLDENNDPCSNNPCRNGGICTVNNADYICSCQKPYSGKRCEIHPCHSSPCLNEGACIDVENTYGCVCTEPFHGKHCESDPCSSAPCNNGGLCSVAGIDFNCSCNPPYSGKQCEITPESTLENKATTISYECDCGPNSTGCQMDNGTKVCHCKNGYAKGNDGMCQDINSTLNETTTKGYFSSVVTEDVCYCGVNSESCSLDWLGRKECKCKNNYAPKNETCAATCNFSDRNCFNGGRCQRENTGYFCQCKGTYIGEKCETDVCVSMRYRCDNMRAVCTRKGETGVCECPPGTIYSRSSDSCNDICSYRTCLNGRCQVRGNSSYICICDEGFYGQHCEIGSEHVYYSAPWGYIIVLSVGIVIFSIALIIVVQWVKKLRKQLEESAKQIRNA